MKAFRIIAVGLILLILGLILYSFFFTSAETRIARAIQKGQRAFNNKHLFNVAVLVSHEYKDDYGFDKSSLVGTVQQFFRDHEKIDVEIRSLQIEVTSPGKAVANAVVVFREKVAYEYFHGVDLRNPNGVYVQMFLIEQGRMWKFKRFALRQVR